MKRPEQPFHTGLTIIGKLARRSGLGLILFALATSGSHDLSHVEQIEARGSMVMLTVYGASTYYLGPDGEAGFEYELARGFAEFLDVSLEVIPRTGVSELLPALDRGQGDLVAANMSRSPTRRALARFGPAYEQVTQQVVYRRGSRRPADLSDLADGRLAIISGTIYEELLESHDGSIDLDWEALDHASIEDLFEAISDEELDYTIIDSNILDLNRRFFPAIRPAFEIGDPQSLAWAVRREDDDSLVQKMREFFLMAEENYWLADLRQRHYSHIEQYEAVGTFHFMQQMRERLPRFRVLFEETAEREDLDWRLLAAIGYQESHWNPEAVSFTGVRGLMMLTRQTASQLGIEDRTDPAQSIAGGARYLRRMLDRIPERIGEPDRLWFALAAYNIGFGHLEDARILTQRQGGDPDRWLDVRERLPLLTQERYFSQTRFGYARGHEAASFVENIRTFYEILVWMEGREHPLIALKAENGNSRLPGNREAVVRDLHLRARH